ncbi:DUF1501 domain-containing protein [Chitinimonas sp. BJB300]|uniref:DUF1501 domain-containing protein n=1 Tax=Chitinimonas sp. BJB300 TaxID=1559339 RepID=UPI000C0ED33F|nr:DUF1501 domain-containing protein [Chitinimonas sp. BJB300]PHV13260.1 Twin-arginine translocation pathway signal sequence domain-containing protein [Chitinimonas sp. BJB300]TSJ89653.1 DUF1501 domain-containing protein [Chitinimonas sp. BJB300]
MNRRAFLQIGSLAALGHLNSTVAWATVVPGNPRLLILVELKGGNDGLNTIAPYADSAYYDLRPKIAIARDQVLQLDERSGLNPAMQALMPIWQAKQLAIVQGVGYPQPNLSHFRSIEIWDTASNSDTVLQTGWLSRQFAAKPLPAGFVTDGIAVGSQDLGPLDGGARALVLQSQDAFVRQAKLADDKAGATKNAALLHLLKVEDDIRIAARGLAATGNLNTTFPDHGFGKTVKTAMEALAANRNIGVFRLTLGSFDTHINQRNQQDRLLGELADGFVALQMALTELGRWNDTLVLSYAEFGRRPQENRSAGTDHGTANAHFVLGGAVRGGLYGKRPDFNALDGGNLRFGVDFRQLYASACRYCWQSDGMAALGGRFEPFPVVA